MDGISYNEGCDDWDQQCKQNSFVTLDIRKRDESDLTKAISIKPIYVKKINEHRRLVFQNDDDYIFQEDPSLKIGFHMWQNADNDFDEKQIQLLDQLQRIGPSRWNDRVWWQE